MDAAARGPGRQTEPPPQRGHGWSTLSYGSRRRTPPATDANRMTTDTKEQARANALACTCTLPR
eukprot:1846200-Alexandrium_andersonii.AAC.1